VPPVLFNSYEFLFVFLPVVLLGWWWLRPPPLRLAFLTASSYVFYAWWDWRFLPLMIASTTVDYVAGRALVRLDDGRRRRAVLVAALAANLAMLGYFKYAGCFVDSLDGLGSALGMGRAFPELSIVLPIGISFYTFNSMSYTIDIYRRQVEPARSVLHYAAFVSMFPHLIAGPIVRYSTIDTQLRRLTPALSWELAASGMFFLSSGLVKKLLIADTLAPHVDRLFAGHAGLGLLGGWAAAAGYALQLYFDFSGYSDMAVGLAFLLGFRFPQNFDSPYKARDISDFWRRWHMSLSFWLRDYLFIPLGGSREGRLRTLRNLGVTMFLGGLWHGAAWTFVVWGLVHGVFLIAHNVLHRAGLSPSSAVVNRAVTFGCVAAAFVIFRAPNLHVAGDMLAAMAGLNGVESMAVAHAEIGTRLAAGIAALLVFVNLAPNTWEVELRPRPVYGLALGAALAAAVLTIGNPSPFIYFRF
jgi:alginate O-acetyltransferase complex protein AlgI